MKKSNDDEMGSARAELDAWHLAEEAKFPFNQMSARADIAYWSVWPEWTIEEGVALLVNRDPRKVPFGAVLPHVKISVLAKKYSDLMALARRTELSGVLNRVNEPRVFLRWAKRANIQVPVPLLSAVEASGISITDWQDVYEKSKVLYEQASALAADRALLITKLSAEVERLQTERDSFAAQLRTRQRKNRSNAEQDIDSREEVSYLNTIGVLLKLLTNPRVDGRPFFSSQAKLVDVIQKEHPQKYGLKARTLNGLFARANNAISGPEG